MGLPAFQLPMFPKCDALPKRIELDMFYFRNPFPPSFARTLNSVGVQRVGKGDLLSRESQSSSNIVRMDVWVVNQWWIRMIFRRKYSASIFDILAGSKQVMPVTVKFRIDFLVCGLQVDLLWHFSTSALCFHVKPRSNEELLRFSF